MVLGTVALAIALSLAVPPPSNLSGAWVWRCQGDGGSTWVMERISDGVYHPRGGLGNQTVFVRGNDRVYVAHGVGSCRRWIWINGRFLSVNYGREELTPKR